MSFLLPMQTRAQSPDTGVSSSVKQWETHEWSQGNSTYSGNAFDLIAKVAFTHVSSGAIRTTEMFYDGADTWKWRFLGEKQGEWTFLTQADGNDGTTRDPELHGLTGAINVTSNPGIPASARILTHDGKRYAAVKDDGSLEPRAFQIAHDLDNYRDNGIADLQELADWAGRVSSMAQAHADYAKSVGADAMFSNPHIQLLELGVTDYNDLSDENPDPASFDIIEQVLREAFKKGISVHYWLWADDERPMTPTGLSGGINGVVDRRLQRYIAARLGPFPNWTMEYGFDLQEWVTSDQVNSWASYMKDRLGWPHLLMARGIAAEEGVVVDGSDASENWRATVLDVNTYSTISSNSSHYGEGLQTSYPYDRLMAFQNIVSDVDAGTNKPHAYLERFPYGRRDATGDSWDVRKTHRALWRFQMAGGVTAIWGRDGKGDYPDKTPMQTYRRFWDSYGDLTYVRDNSITDGYALRRDAPTDYRYVFYIEGASSIQVNLSGASGSLRAVAIDTQRKYEEISFGTLQPRQQTLTLPRESDWAVAVEYLGDTGHNGIDYNLPAGWELVGFPFEQEGMEYTALFPDADGFFGFDGRYVAEAEGIQPGRGYWISHESDPPSRTIEGVTVPAVSTTLDAGWNLISGPDCAVGVSEITDPDGVVIPGTLYGYQYTYIESQILQPGRGYWLRAAGDRPGQPAGEVTISCTTEKSGTEAVYTAADIKDFGMLRVSDGEDLHRDLYFGHDLPDGADALSYSLPALPPGGGFDARFANDSKLVERLESDLIITTQNFPLALSLERMPANADEMELFIEERVDGAVIRAHPISSDQDVVFEEPVAGQLRLASSEPSAAGWENEKPVAANLVPNHPNPFQEKTTLRYVLPRTEDVRLTVYDALGRLVDVLADGVQPAGTYVVNWTASGLPSGVYYTVIEAGTYRASQQMVRVH